MAESGITIPKDSGIARSEGPPVGRALRTGRVTQGFRKTDTPYISTTNACKLCKPLGACLVFRGIEGAIPFLHGSQGCATYMRRYLISHFREPVDIASSSLGEKHAVYGGGPNLKQGLVNVTNKYQPSLIGVATTCLTETIGDDVPFLVAEYRREVAAENPDVELPALVTVSTPSYAGTHMEGFHVAVKGVVEQLAAAAQPARAAERAHKINLLPGLVSPADIRYLKDIVADFGLHGTILPDISESLDGPSWEEYQKIPAGGTPLDEIRTMGGAKATLEFGRTLEGTATAGADLRDRLGVPLYPMGLPIGLRASDRLIEVLETVSGVDTPVRHNRDRERLVDAYVDGHKYLAGKKAIVFGEEDLVIGMTAFLAEIGVRPVLVAGGGKSGRLREAIGEVTEGLLPEAPQVRDGVDFFEIAEEAEDLAPDLLVGNSKGYHLSKRWNVPLVRVGFPIHDRFGGQRRLHLGYRGAQELFDRLVNAMIEAKQEGSEVGYGYL